LNEYDYGARFYDPAYGRFHSIDPIIENWQSHTPYNYAFSNPSSSVDLWGLQGVSNYEYFNWMVNNPQGAFADGFRQIFDAAASVFTAKAGVSISQKTNIIEGKLGNFSVSGSTVTESNAEISFDASGMFDYSGDNKVSWSQLNPFKAEISSETKVEVEAKASLSVDGIPVDVSKSHSKNSSGEMTNKREIAVGVSGKSVEANVYINSSTTSQSNGASKTNVALGSKANVTVIKEDFGKTQIGVYAEIQTRIE
jgi:hypothetical protein